MFVRLTDEPSPPAALGGWPLPSELAYRHRPPYTRTPDGGVKSTRRSAAMKPKGSRRWDRRRDICQAARR